eukprot:7690206-Pyramimonas_sp.AAC.1
MIHIGRRLRFTTEPHPSMELLRKLEQRVIGVEKVSGESFLPSGERASSIFVTNGGVCKQFCGAGSSF